MRTYTIETFGCQMNEHDSEGIAGILSGLGLSPVGSVAGADVVVLNTCSVRDKPHRKVYSRLQDLRQAKKRRPELVVIVAGCMAQLIPEEIAAKAPHVDLLVGPGSYARLEEALRGVLGDERAGRRDLLELCAPDSSPIPYARAEAFRAWVNVMFGCDNRCAYCVVPYARGPEVSRRPEAIIEEVEQLAREGVVEVTLLGQNVNSYGRGLGGEPQPRFPRAMDGAPRRIGRDESRPYTASVRQWPVDFADLLERVNAVEGLRRIRFTTSHPKDLSRKLIEAMAGLENVCEHLHLPVQAGSDAVLARMGRGHTAGQYRELVRAAREAIPGLAVTTDVMVGFPGETEEDFGQTLALFEELRYDQAFMFKYNDRPGTPASDLPNKVPEPEKQRRLERLVSAQNRIAREINEERVGEEFEVLVEGPDEKTLGQARGRTRQNKLVILPGDEGLTGRFVTVTVRQARLWGWIGERQGTGDG